MTTSLPRPASWLPAAPVHPWARQRPGTVRGEPSAGLPVTPSSLPYVELQFYFIAMKSSDPDRIRYAQIAAAAARHLQSWPCTADEQAAAVIELTQAAAGRADLLAERAGTALGFSDGGLERARNRLIAELCIAAGADNELIGRWIAVGRELAAKVATTPACRPPTDCAPALRADTYGGSGQPVRPGRGDREPGRS